MINENVKILSSKKFNINDCDDDRFITFFKREIKFLKFYHQEGGKNFETNMVLFFHKHEEELKSKISDVLMVIRNPLILNNLDSFLNLNLIKNDDFTNDVAFYALIEYSQEKNKYQKYNENDYSNFIYNKLLFNQEHIKYVKNKIDTLIKLNLFEDMILLLHNSEFLNKNKFISHIKVTHIDYLHDLETNYITDNNKFMLDILNQILNNNNDDKKGDDNKIVRKKMF